MRFSRSARSALLVVGCLAGCGPSETVMNDQPLTEDQKAAILQEDSLVDMEEQGSQYAPAGKR